MGTADLIPTAAAGAVKFAPPTDLQAALKDAVTAYFERTRIAPSGGSRILAKSATILLWLAASYGLLVFGATTWWQALPCALSLSFAIAAVGFNIQHDGNHGAFSGNAPLNRAAGFTLDLLGGSSYFWRRKHNLLHHTYTNLCGWDDDISLGALGRLSPHQRRLPIHRLQHIYLWPLYGILAIKWQLFDDFRTLAKGRIGPRAVPRPKGTELAAFLVGKATSLTLAFGLPLLVRPLPQVAIFYVLTMGMAGVVLSVVFQLAHCVEEARQPPTPEEGASTGHDWVRHQLATSVDFARSNRLVTWYAGGLNMQVEHHLFPKVSHVHYPALSPIVESVAARHGVAHRSHPTLRAAIRSHYRYLKAMGQATPALARAA